MVNRPSLLLLVRHGESQRNIAKKRNRLFLDDESRKAVRGTPDPVELYVYTAEDILLQKLRSFRLGREVSDRQWRDILGIVVVQGEDLDRSYLEGCAAELGVENLLERALGEAG